MKPYTDPILTKLKKVGFWDPLNRFQLSLLYLPKQHLSISGIFHLLLTRFWPNFKGRLMGTCRTDSKWPSDICIDNICPGDIYPYVEYLSCYQPDFDQTLKEGSWEHLEEFPNVMVIFVQTTHVLATFVHVSNISTVTNLFLTKLLGSNFVGLLIFVDQHLFWSNLLLIQIIVWPKMFWPTSFLTKFFRARFFTSKNFFYPNFFEPKND